MTPQRSVFNKCCNDQVRANAADPDGFVLRNTSNFVLILIASIGKMLDFSRMHQASESNLAGGKEADCAPNVHRISLANRIKKEEEMRCIRTRSYIAQGRTNSPGANWDSRKLAAGRAHGWASH